MIIGSLTHSELYLRRAQDDSSRRADHRRAFATSGRARRGHGTAEAAVTLLPCVPVAVLFQPPLYEKARVEHLEQPALTLMILPFFESEQSTVVLA